MTRNNIFQVWKPGRACIGQAGPGNDFGSDLCGAPLYQKGNGWQSEANGLYQLAPESPGFDAGARIPNFNDDFTGAGPDVGAHEAGTPPMQFGINARLKAGSAR